MKGTGWNANAATAMSFHAGRLLPPKSAAILGLVLIDGVNVVATVVAMAYQAREMPGRPRSFFWADFSIF
jgi:hypothetical protein